MTDIFVNRVKEALWHKGWTQKKLAEEVGVTQITMSTYLRDNKRHIPPMDVAAKMAKALDVSIGWLCGDDNVVDAVFDVIISNSSEVIDILSKYQVVKNQTFLYGGINENLIPTLVDCYENTKAQLQKIWEV